MTDCSTWQKRLPTCCCKAGSRWMKLKPRIWAYFLPNRKWPCSMFCGPANSRNPLPHLNRIFQSQMRLPAKKSGPLTLPDDPHAASPSRSRKQKAAHGFFAYWDPQRGKNFPPFCFPHVWYLRAHKRFNTNPLQRRLIAQLQRRHRDFHAIDLKFA